MFSMLDLHEFSGSMTFETNLGIESVDFSYNLFMAEDSDPELLEYAARAIAQLIVRDTIDKGPNQSNFSQN